MALQKRKTMTPLALDAFDLARDDAINLAISQIAIENNTTEVREDLIIKTRDRSTGFPTAPALRVGTEEPPEAPDGTETATRPPTSLPPLPATAGRSS